MQTEFTDRSLYCSPTLVDRLTSSEAISLSMRDTDEYNHAFTAPLSWIFKRQHFSARGLHVKKRSDPDDELVSRFLNEWGIAEQQFTFDNTLTPGEIP